MKNVTPEKQAALSAQPFTTANGHHTSSQKNVLYDERYEKDNDVTILGVFLFLIPIFFMVFCNKKGSIFQDANLFIEILLSAGVLFRVFASVYVAKMAAQLNRSVLSWVYLAVLLPGSSLMIIGQKKRFLTPDKQTAKNNYQGMDATPALS